VVSGLYKLRPSATFIPPSNYCVYREGENKIAPLELHKDFEYGDIVTADIIAFGCTLFSREVLEKVAYTIGLDCEFFRNCRKQGFKLACDTGCRCSHIEEDGTVIES